MSSELNCRFSSPDHFAIRFGDEEGSGQILFENPITEKDLRDIMWYVETYGAHSLGDPDDQEAFRIAGLLRDWGADLFNAMFGAGEAFARYLKFRTSLVEGGLLTISSDHPTILGLPWELLRDPSRGGVFLFMENPAISIRRRVSGASGDRAPFVPIPKEKLNLLFVVCRPDGAGFIDPRCDSQPTLDAIEQHAPGRVTAEFLRPPTLDALVDRLNDMTKPPVDILHFDGHGVFDREGDLPKRFAKNHEDHTHNAPSGAHQKRADPSHDPDYPPNTGYLLFETPDGQADLVSAEKLGESVHRRQVALVILSACQSATIGVTRNDSDGQVEAPMGSVAARLTAAGIPSVLAMTHSVLVDTTRALFGEFYKSLARPVAVGEALDTARRYLDRHPEKYEVQRGPERRWLKLDDWFLPALYQPGADGPLLLVPRLGEKRDVQEPKTNLSKRPEAGFSGRRRELWDIERWFAGPTRRITITGFGGQGKSALAQEAGRWLTRTGLFEAAVFVDFSHIQAADTVAVAVSNIAAVLGESLIDAKAATEALKRTPTLVILDNLEALEPDSLKLLLDAAVAWSGVGSSRILCTTRQPDFNHLAYRVAGTNEHRRIRLEGLGSKHSPQDALEWYASLMKLPPAPTVPPPKREAVIELFDRVKFHPLSIRVLVQQLKTRGPADLGERLESLLTQFSSETSGPGEDKDTPAGLLASLELSLDRLDEAARDALPRLGVFEGGAFEDELIAIAGFGDSGDKGEPVVAPKLTNRLWSDLRQQLEAAALIEAEDVLGVGSSYLRFHPTLAPMLWAQLDAASRQSLSAAHRQHYHDLSRFLYNADRRNPHEARAIAWLELPNLLRAVYGSLDFDDPGAVDFADSVIRFLVSFGLKRESARLSARVQSLAGEVGSRPWYLALSNQGEQLREAGQVKEAEKVFQEILEQLEESPTYERALTIGRLGRCRRQGGWPDLAVETFRQALTVCDALEPNEFVKQCRGTLFIDIAATLTRQGKYAEARLTYQAGLEIDEELGDLRGKGVTLSHLGTLAMLEGNLKDASERYQAALIQFRNLGEPASEATALHQLGLVSQGLGEWGEAERHFRESARINEQLSYLSNAAATWNQLAIVCKALGKLDVAEEWYRKAIDSFRAVEDTLSQARCLNNLANLLQAQTGRLGEAKQLAEEALDIRKTIDPGYAEIWSTYGVLSAIADRESQAAVDQLKANLRSDAREYRRLARQAKRNFAGTRHELKRFAELIVATVMALVNTSERKELELLLPVVEQRGWVNLVDAIQRILDGERNSDILCDNLDLEDSMVVEAILQGIADPTSLSDWMREESE